MPRATSDRSGTGRLAITVAIVSLVNAATIILLYTVAPIFGPTNDIGVATAAVLQAALAFRLRSTLGVHVSTTSVLAATIGAGVAVVGSGLVVAGATGWFLAGLVTTLGYAFLGVWVLAANRRAREVAAWPPALAAFGIWVGGIMCLGFLAALGLPSSVDDPSAAPWFVWIAYANGVGWFILLPIWNLRLGRYLSAGT